MTKASKEGQRKAPILRFKGFTDDWEQRKLGEIFKFSQGLQVPIDQQFERKEENTERFIRIVDVTQDNIPQRFVYNPTGKGRVNLDDIFFVRYGAVGTIGHGFKGVIANNLFKVIPLIDINPLFWFYQFSDIRFNSRLKALSASTSMPAINFNTLRKMIISNTSIVEQNKIGTILKSLDNLLTLYDRKTKLIKQIQSSFLDCFFSETNNVTSLNHFLRIRNGYAFKSSELTENGEIPVVKISNIGSNKPFTFTTKAKSKEQFTLYPNDIIIALSGATAGKINQVANKYPLYYQNQRVGFFEIKNDRLNCEYLNSFLHSKKFKSQLQKTLVAGAQPNITPKDIEKIKIPFLEYELQQTIGQVNKYLFELQRINKDKLTLLNKIKKTLLNNMFV